MSRRLVLDWSVRRGDVEGPRSGVRRHTVREGLVLVLTDPDGRRGRGEASPLPGYSPDTLEGVRAALGVFSAALLPVPEPGVRGRELLAAAGPALAPLPASGRFALETALLDLLGQLNRQPIWSILGMGGEAPAPVPLCDLVGGTDTHDIVLAARRSAATTVKVKLVGPALGSQLATLERVREAIGRRALRLDANGTLAGASLPQDLGSLCSLTPELVEEPARPDELRRALGGNPPLLPVALDESLQDAAAWPALEANLGTLGVKALILKPMALGGFSHCLELADAADRLGIHATVSHLFDGPIALAAACHLAVAIGSRHHASGLTRHGGLSAWPAIDVPGLGDAVLQATDRPGLGLPSVEDAT